MTECKMWALQQQHPTKPLYCCCWNSSHGALLLLCIDACLRLFFKARLSQCPLDGSTSSSIAPLDNGPNLSPSPLTTYLLAWLLFLGRDYPSMTSYWVLRIGLPIRLLFGSLQQFDRKNIVFWWFQWNCHFLINNAKKTVPVKLQCPLDATSNTFGLAAL